MVTTGDLLRKRYRIVELLGEGGFGRTFLATDTQQEGKPLGVVKEIKRKTLSIT